MKNKWRNYALKDGKVKESYIREYCNRKKSGKAGETGYRNCFQQSGKEQEEVKLVYRPGMPIDNTPIILNDAWIVNLASSKKVQEQQKNFAKKEGEKENGKSEIGVGEPIQSNREESSSIRSRKSSSSSSRRRDKEVRKSEDGENGTSG